MTLEEVPSCYGLLLFIILFWGCEAKNNQEKGSKNISDPNSVYLQNQISVYSEYLDAIKKEHLEISDLVPYAELSSGRLYLSIESIQNIFKDKLNKVDSLNYYLAGTHSIDHYQLYHFQFEDQLISRDVVLLYSIKDDLILDLSTFTSLVKTDNDFFMIADISFTNSGFSIMYSEPRNLNSKAYRHITKDNALWHRDYKVIDNKLISVEQ